MKVALIIGHNSRSKGAYSSIIGSEFDYWKRIAMKIKTIIPGVVDVYERSPNKYYTREMFQILEELNIYHKNNKAKMLATNFMHQLHNIFNVKIRNNHGINLVSSSQVRGGYGICKSKWTYILIEPFFGSNPGEALKFYDKNRIVELLIKFIIENT